MSFTKEDIKKTADLAKLNLSEQEIDIYCEQISGVLQYMNEMKKIDTTDIEPLTHPLEMFQRLRPDSVTEKNERELLQQNAPRVEAGVYLVPAVTAKWKDKQ